MLEKPVAQGVISLLLFEVFIRYPNTWMLLVPAIGVVSLYFFWWWQETFRGERHTHWPSFILELLFFFASLAALVVPESPISRHVLAIGSAVILTSFCMQMCSVRGDIRERPPLLVFSITLLTTLVLFLSGAFFISLSYYIGIRSLLSLALIVCIHVGVIYVYTRALAITSRHSALTLLTAALVIFQTLWVLQFLPHGAFTRSFIYTIIVGLFITQERDRAFGHIDMPRMIRKVAAGVAALALILFVTRWS